MDEVTMIKSQSIIICPRVTSLYLLIMEAMISVPPVEPLLRNTMPMPMPSMAAPKMHDRKMLFLTTCGSPLFGFTAPNQSGCSTARVRITSCAMPKRKVSMNTA